MRAPICIKEAERLYLDGMSLDGVAKHYGVSRTAISQRFSTAGIKPRVSGRRLPLVGTHLVPIFADYFGIHEREATLLAVLYEATVPRRPIPHLVPAIRAAMEPGGVCWLNRNIVLSETGRAECDLAIRVSGQALGMAA